MKRSRYGLKLRKKKLRLWFETAGIYEVAGKKWLLLKPHGSNHDIFVNSQNGRKAPVPRHPEIKDSLCKLIMKQLGIAEEK